MKGIRMFIIVFIVFGLMFCYRTFSSKENLIGNYYLVEHESAKGKSLIVFEDGEPVSTLILGSISKLKGNRKLMVVEYYDTQEEITKYYYLNIPKVRYPERMEEISQEKFDSIFVHLDAEYNFIDANAEN